MPRRRSVNLVRDIGVDPRFGSLLVQKLINTLMERGKKNIAREIVYEAMDLLIKKMNGNQDKAVELFHHAFENIIPAIEVRPRRVGGGVYQIPMEVSEHRGRSLAIRWIVEAAGERKDKTMGIRLAYELLDALEGRGGAVKKKSDVHRMAESNRAFSHYAW